jgi:hypothetical protein
VDHKVNADNEQKNPQMTLQNNEKKERSKTALNTAKQKLPEKKDYTAKTTRKETKKTTSEPKKIITKDFKKEGKQPQTAGSSRNDKQKKVHLTQPSPSDKLAVTKKLVEIKREDFEFIDTASILSPTFVNKLKAHTFESKAEENENNKLNEELENALTKLKLCYSNSSLDEILKEKAITQEQALTLFKDLNAKLDVLEKEIQDSSTKELPELKLEKCKDEVTLSQPLSEDTIKDLKILLAILNQWDIALDTNTFTEKALECLKANNDMFTYLRKEVTKRFPLLTGEDIIKLKTLIQDIKELKDCKVMYKSLIHPVIEDIGIDKAGSYFELKATEYKFSVLKEVIAKLKDIVSPEVIKK